MTEDQLSRFNDIGAYTILEDHMLIISYRYLYFLLQDEKKTSEVREQERKEERDDRKPQQNVDFFFAKATKTEAFKEGLIAQVSLVSLP